VNFICLLSPVALEGIAGVLQGGMFDKLEVRIKFSGANEFAPTV